MDRKDELLRELKKGINQLDDLIKFLNKHSLELKFAYNLLEGFNYCEEYFDFNFGVGAHTLIVNDKNKLELSESVELWDDERFEYLGVVSEI